MPPAWGANPSSIDTTHTKIKKYAGGARGGTSFAGSSGRKDRGEKRWGAERHANGKDWSKVSDSGSDRGRDQR
jgi:hypothetical protein